MHILDFSLFLVALPAISGYQLIGVSTIAFAIANIRIP